jgi:hypothetical protein
VQEGTNDPREGPRARAFDGYRAGRLEGLHEVRLTQIRSYASSLAARSLRRRASHSAARRASWASWVRRSWVVGLGDVDVAFGLADVDIACCWNHRATTKQRCVQVGILFWDGGGDEDGWGGQRGNTWGRQGVRGEGEWGRGKGIACSVVFGRGSHYVPPSARLSLPRSV